MKLPVKALLTAAIALTSTAAFADDAKPAAPAPGGVYTVAKVLNVGGEGRWDYVIVDPKTGLLYVPRQSHTMILKADSGEIVADLKDTPGVHGVAVAPDANRGFASDGQKNCVTVFDLTTHKDLGTIPTGEKPDAIIYDLGSKKILAFCGKSNDVTVINPAEDPASAKPAKIALDGAPEFAAGDGAGHVYVNLEDKDSVDAIDMKTMKVTGQWKIEGGDGPTGLAIDAVHHRIFSGCHNNVMAILDTETGKTLATVPIGKGVDACAFDPGTGEAFASCGDGTLTVVKETSPGKFEVQQTVKTRPGARTMALDATTHTIYLPTAEMMPAEAGKRPTAKPGTFIIVVVSRTGK